MQLKSDEETQDNRRSTGKIVIIFTAQKFGPEITY